MPETSTKAEVEAKLHGTSETIQSRIDAIQEEVSTIGVALRDILRKHPLASVGGSLVAGLLVGWLVSGGRRRRLSRAHRRLLEHYIEALRDEVRAAVADGAEVGEAVQDALHNRAPLIVYSENGTSSRGMLRQVFDFTLEAALTMAARSMMAGMFDPSRIEEFVEEERAVGADVPAADESSAS